MTDSGPNLKFISMADILSGKADLGDDFGQDYESVVNNQNEKKTSNVSCFSILKLLLTTCSLYMICFF